MPPARNYNVFMRNAIVLFIRALLILYIIIMENQIGFSKRPSSPADEIGHLIPTESFSSRVIIEILRIYRNTKGHGEDLLL